MGRKICILCERWESGGIESFLCNVLLRIDMTDLNVDIVAAEIKESIFTQKLKDKGINFIELSGNCYNIFKNYALFKRLLKEERYSVVHLNAFQGMSLYYIHLAKFHGVPCRIIHSHNSALRQSKLRWIKTVVHNIYSLLFAQDGTDFWSCSQRAARFLFPEELLRRMNYVLIPNGIDTDRFQFYFEIRERTRKKLHLSDKFVIGNVGRLCEQKNQKFLLEVFSRVLIDRPNSVLLFVGEGVDCNQLKELAEQLNIAKSVIFYGNSDKVEELLCAMDVFAMPSFFEGLPLVVVEAQASGLPILYNEDLAREAALTDTFYFLPLSIKDWTRVLLTLENNSNNEREHAAKIVKLKGYDIRNTVNTIAKFYTGSY